MSRSYWVVTAVPLPGHIPGQIGVLIESGDEQLMHLADLLHSPMQFAHPMWSPSFDVDTSISVPTWRDTRLRAADECMLTLFYHLTFPGLGWVKHAATGFAWEPLVTVKSSHMRRFAMSKAVPDTTRIYG